MNHLFHDLRSAGRQFTQRPGFSAVAVLTLALGIGTAAVIFSVVYGLMLKPLPYARPERLVRLHAVNAGQKSGDGGEFGVAPATLAELQAAPPPGFESLAGSTYGYQNLTRVPTPTQLTVGLVTADYFRVLGVSAQLGRTLRAEDCRTASPPVAVLGNALWRQQFNADPTVVGRSIVLNDQPHTVVGVMPPEFKEPQNVAELWLSLAADGPAMQSRADHYLTALGRLSAGGDGRDLAAARAALDVVSANLAQTYPAEERGWSLTVTPLREEVVRDYRRGLWLLLGAVGGVLLVTCANVAVLQLVRASGRRRELGIRLALGAGRGRIVRQLLTESLLLAAVGGGLGVLLAAWGVDAVVALLPAGYSPRQEEIALNTPVLVFAVATAGLTGVLFGALPAWFASRQDPAGEVALHRQSGASSNSGGSRGASAGPGAIRSREWLVAGEIAAACVLLVGAGLMVRSFLGLLNVAPGLRTERVLTLGLSLSDTRYENAAQRTDFYRRVLDTTRALPGVANVGLASTQPFNWNLAYTFTKPGQTAELATAAGQSATFDSVNPEFFAALDVPIRRGRGFGGQDTADAPKVAVVSEQFVRRFFPGTDPLGQELTLTGFRAPLTVQIVGVAADVRRFGLEKEPAAQLYVSYRQRPMTFATLFVRAAGDDLPAESLTKPVQAAIWKLDPDQPITNVSTLERAVRNSVGPTRLYLALFTLFAGLTLGLAALGLYATVAFSVGQRTREFGIRLALGASPGNLRWLVLGQGARLVAGGLGIGLLAAFGLSRLLAGLLYGVGAADPATFAGVALLLAGVALLASYLPARQAMRVDPVVALKAE